MVTQLAVGLLKFSVFHGEAKGLSWDRGAATFIPLVYDIFGDVALNMPSTGNSV